MQCHQCGNIYPIYQTYPESSIKDRLETVSNPSETNESIFLALETRKEQWRKGKRRNRLSNKDQDPEIEKELRKGNTVTII